MNAIRQRLMLFRWVALAFYLIASASVGFAHRAHAAPVDPLAEFVLPDGTRPVICATAKDLSDEAQALPHKFVSGPCEACRLSSVPGLEPVLANCVPVERASEAVFYSDMASVRDGYVADRSHQARGPPTAGL